MRTNGPPPPKTRAMPGVAASTAQVQELQVPFVLADDVVDDLLAAVADQVVILDAIEQLHFSNCAEAAAGRTAI